ncbi:MAG: YihY/virulence factor BrkB family protein [Syntrophobacterales bacterium]|nr:YihY/virulence factor BrkB family protein [Syntrophobacterales bacterium]
MANLLVDLKVFFRRRLWQDEGLSPVQLLAAKCLRVVALAGRGLIRNQSLVRSSSLAYATILGFIPLFALLFAILQAIGVPRLLATYTLEHLAPGSRDFATQILQYIETTKVTSLGVFGVVALLFDLVIVMTNVEKAFNKTWQVSRTRPLSRKISDYLSIFLIFPILMAMALTFSTSFWGLRHVIEILSGIMPAIFFTAARWLVSLGMVWFAFIFIYLVMPNTRVSFWSAILGGVVGGTVWQVAQWIFVGIQAGAAYYNAIYGAFYNLLFLFIWLFWCWLILLFGTEIAFAHQNLECLTRQFRQPGQPPEPVDEYLCLAALVTIGARFSQRQPPLSLDELSRILPRGNNLAHQVTRALQDCNLVVEVVPDRAKSSPRYLPNLPLDQVSVKEVLDCLRESRGAALYTALADEPRLITLLKPLVESPAPPSWQSFTMQDLVEAYAENGSASQDGEDAHST